jgi:hypothetical protein
MLLAVKATRSTFTSRLSSGSSPRAGNGVSINLQSAKSVRETTNSTDVGMSAPPVGAACLPMPMSVLRQGLF